MEFQINVDDIVKAVRKDLAKPENVWDNYVPILESKEDKTLSIYLTEVISYPGEYNQACRMLVNVPEDWEVDITLSTPGGDVASAFCLLDAMQKCKAPIHGFIAGSVASAGTIIAMGCDTLEMADFSDFMCHNYSHDAQGSGAQVKEYVNFTDREFTTASRSIYEGFLSESEIASISGDDKEIWLNKTEVLSRWPNKKFRTVRGE